MAKQRRRGASAPESKRNWREDRADVYRRISVRMYADGAFRALSPLKPSGQALWLYLLTGPHTNLLPGLFSAGRAGLAEILGWSQEDFDSCWSEVEREELVQAAWRERVVWVPNAIKYNEPASPSVVVSWRSHWPLIPECNLKWAAYRHLRNYLETHKGPAFVSAFVSACLVPDGSETEQGAPHDVVQAAPNAASHQEQEAGAGAGTGAGTGVVVRPPRHPVGSGAGIALVSEAWSEVGMTRDLAISGEPYAFATGRLADGVPVDHLVQALHAARWFVDNGAKFSLQTLWFKLVEKTPAGSPFRWDDLEAPSSRPTSGKVVLADDPFAGTPNEFFRPPKQQRVGRIR